MRAIFITEFGGPEKIQAGELPKPVPGTGQALIRVKVGRTADGATPVCFASSPIEKF